MFGVTPPQTLEFTSVVVKFPVELQLTEADWLQRITNIQQLAARVGAVPPVPRGFVRAFKPITFQVEDRVYTCAGKAIVTVAARAGPGGVGGLVKQFPIANSALELTGRVTFKPLDNATKPPTCPDCRTELMAMPEGPKRQLALHRLRGAVGAHAHGAVCLTGLVPNPVFKTACAICVPYCYPPDTQSGGGRGGRGVTGGRGGTGGHTSGRGDPAGRGNHRASHDPKKRNPRRRRLTRWRAASPGSE